MTDRSPYFEKARDWASDTRLHEARLRRIALTVAGIATAIALFEAVALALLTPLKTVQPITLLVDRQTGYVQALDPLQPRKIAADAALTQSFLAQYVAAREGFDRATVVTDYRRVALWSSGPARSQYLALMPASNPSSPLRRYPAGTIVAARVKSVSPLANGTALVRFETARADRGSDAGPSQPWISVVHYRYTDAPMSFEDRLINPLGFQVTGYRRDMEAAPAPSPPITADNDAEGRGQVPARRTAAVEPPAQALPQRQPRALAERGEVRTVPINQLPLGSPLGQGGGPAAHIAYGGQP